MARATLDVEVDYLNAAGDGVAWHGRRQLTVPFTLPGERVRVMPGPPRDGVSMAALEDVLRPSPDRVRPRCRHFGPAVLRVPPPGGLASLGPCGGCAWQHIAYARQLQLKSELVTRLVREQVPGAPAAHAMLPGVLAGEPWNYRHKVHFVFASARGRGPRARARLAMGHYLRGSRRVLPIAECPVHDERGNAAAFALRDAYAAAGVAGAPDGPLRSVAVRVSRDAGEVMATLVLTREADARVRGATRRVLGQPGAPASFHVNLHPGHDAFIFGRETRTIAGHPRLRETVAGVSFLVSPTAFFQTNVHAAERLVGLVLDALPAARRVLDLYAGAGLFALPIARTGHRVVAVEESRAAVSDGEASRRLNRIPEEHCRFVARRVEQALDTPVLRVPFDAVVLDPPRDGCPAAVLEAVFGRIRPPTAVYVSCNPEALARDLAVICRHRYRIVSMQPLDMFPHTPHVETVALLTR